MKTFSRVAMPYAKVLIVDDIQTNLLFAKGILKPYGMQVDFATSGIEAIELIRNQTVRYDAIFMDYAMPEMDGMEAVRIIREEIDSDYARNIPIIALTGSDAAEDERKFLEKGFQAYLNKPIDVLGMDTILRQWVQKDGAFDSGSMPTADTEAGQIPGNTGQACTEDSPQIEGINWQTGLNYCAGNRDAYLSVIRSYIDSMAYLIPRICRVTEETLADYMIHVHGIKGSSYGIGANEIGKQAEELEHAARAGNFQLVSRDTPLFAENARKLLDALSNLLKTCSSEAAEKPIQYAPNESLLDQMEEAAANFNIDELEKTMKSLECFKYETQAELITWLHEKVNQMEFLAIHERLVQRKQQTPEGKQ